MLPVVSMFLQDNESLLEYERNWGKSSYRKQSLSDIIMKIVSAERSNFKFMTDSYYDGQGDILLADKYKSLNELVWRLPYDIAKSYLVVIGNSIYVQGIKFNDWSDLIVRIPPSLLIASFLSDEFSMSKIYSMANIGAFIRKWLLAYEHTTLVHPYIPDYSYWVKHTNGLNDLHVHLNGTTETDKIWSEMICSTYEIISDYADTYSRSQKVRKLSAQIYPGFSPDTLADMLFHAKQLRKALCSCIGRLEYGKSNCNNLHELYGDIYHKMNYGDLIEEILFCLFIICELRKKNHPVMAQMFHHYLLIKSVVHRFAVMQYTQVGFSQFQMLTTNSFRWASEKLYTNRFLQLSGTLEGRNIGVVEGRFSPQETSIANQNMVKLIKKGFDAALVRLQSKKMCNNLTLSLVAHFIKKPETHSSKRMLVRHNMLRKELDIKCSALIASMKSSCVSTLVHGVDAAASEFDAGPEVFSPIYRKLRRAGIRHFTFHSGEDFCHLISGLRAIIEAIDYLELYPGDRLGHCTAAGIDPYLWKNRQNGTIVISQGEWLEDLVFAWHWLGEKGCSEYMDTLRAIESKIHELSLLIYGTVYLPLQLYHFWEMKKYDPFVYLTSNSISVTTSTHHEIEEYHMVKKRIEEYGIKDILTKYHAPIENHAYSKHRQAYDKLITIGCDDFVPIELQLKLQSFVLDYIARRGIVIESLPSSNLRISYYRKIEEYHLEKWLKSMQDNLLLPSVVLGTDDPGIFLTNIFNEYARVYCYLFDKGYSPAESMDMIKRLHENSLIYKFE